MTLSGKFLQIPRDSLTSYVARQIDTLFPDGAEDTREQIGQVIEEAIARLAYCTDNVRMWRGTGFHPLHSEKNSIFLYYLSNTLFKNGGAKTLCEKIFYLNKSLNGFHCFYDTELPDIFFVGHSIGIVLVKMTYPRYLAIYQGVTIGKNREQTPVLEEGLVLYPGSTIIGRCHVRARTIVTPNTAIVNTDTPGDCIAYQSGDGLMFKKSKRDFLSDFFI